MVGDRAQHERNDSSVEGCCLAGEPVGTTVLDRHRHGRCRCGKLSTFPQVGLGLDGHYPTDRSRIVLEVRAAAGTDLHYATLQSREQLMTMGGAATFTYLSNASVDAGEHRAQGVFRHQLPAGPLSARIESSTPASSGTQIEQ